MMRIFHKFMDIGRSYLKFETNRRAHSLIKLTPQDERSELMDIWPNIVYEVRNIDDNIHLPDAANWISKLLESNVPNGKLNRAMFVLSSYKMLANPDQLTEDNIQLAKILGWCTEILQASLIIHDDMVDCAATRRGKPCWYLQNNIGLAPINDGFILQQIIYQLLKNHFKDKPCYLNLIETFHEGNIFAAGSLITTKYVNDLHKMCINVIPHWAALFT